MKEISIESVLNIINRSDNLEINQEQIAENLVELGMDSITFIQLVVALEEEFECEVPNEKLLIAEMDTVQKIIDVFQSLYGD